MKFICTLVILILFTTSGVFAQFGLGERLKRKVEEKIEQKIEQKSEEAIEKALEEPSEDTESEKENNSEKNNENAGSSTTNPNLTPSMQTYSKFDFIPGDRIIFFDDFSQDNVGDFPAKWNTNGSGEVITTSLYGGKWLKLIDDALYAPDVNYPFPENFTLEFDVLGNFKMEFPYQFFGYLKVALVELEDPKRNIGNGHDKAVAHSEFELKFGDGQSAWVKGSDDLGMNVGNDINGKWLEGLHAKPFHISISVNKQRYRMWINQSKVFDLPRMISKETKFNSIRFVPYNINTNKDYDLLITNIKFAEGSVDTRSKLITEGKLVTNAITFASGSDKIKPESYPMLKSIADALVSNPTINIMIIGHTDTDGVPDKNQTLSEARSLSIKNSLINDFGISPDRLQTSGKGDKEPIAENTSSEGKAKNRRVEFVKI